MSGLNSLKSPFLRSCISLYLKYLMLALEGVTPDSSASYMPSSNTKKSPRLAKSATVEAAQEAPLE